MREYLVVLYQHSSITTDVKMITTVTIVATSDDATIIKLFGEFAVRGSRF